MIQFQMKSVSIKSRYCSLVFNELQTDESPCVSKTKTCWAEKMLRIDKIAIVVFDSAVNTHAIFQQKTNHTFRTLWVKQITAEDKFHDTAEMS